MTEGQAVLQQPRHVRLTTAKFLTRILLLVMGAGLVSVALEIFLVPNAIIDGGITGISIITSHRPACPSVYFSSSSICLFSSSVISKSAKPLPSPRCSA